MAVEPEHTAAAGPVIDIVISTSRPELEEGQRVGLEYPELAIKALIDTGAALTIVNP